MSKKTTTTVDNVEIEINDGKSSARVGFDNWDDALKFLQTDCWDTYKDLQDTKWKTLSKTNKKRLRTKQNFVDNKNAAVATLAMFYDGAIDYVEKQLKEFKEKQKDLKAFTKNDV